MEHDPTVNQVRPQVWCAMAILCLVATACRGDQGGSAAERSLDSVEFFMPAQLPSGWSLGHATQRIEMIGGPDGRTLKVSDYTVVWRPERLAGAVRSESTGIDSGPWLALNSGSAYYNETYAELLGAERPDVQPLDEAEVKHVGGLLELTFIVDCCLVSLTSDGIDPDELGAIAESVTSLDQHEWREALADRLLIDDQTS